MEKITAKKKYDAFECTKLFNKTGGWKNWLDYTSKYLENSMEEPDFEQRKNLRYIRLHI